MTTIIIITMLMTEIAMEERNDLEMSMYTSRQLVMDNEVQHQEEKPVLRRSQTEEAELQ